MIRALLPALALLLAIQLASVGQAPVALAQGETIVIEGRVTNGTPGGGAVSGLTIILHQESATSHVDLESVTNDEGRFRFEDIAFDAATSYGVSTRYQNALYGQDLEASNGVFAPVALAVYEAAQDQELLSALSVSLLLAEADSGSQTISALEIVTIANDSEYTYVAGSDPMSLLRFGLPTGAEELTVDTRLPGADYVQVDRGFALLASVPPGEHEVMFAYRFPYSGTDTTFTKSLPYGASRLRVMAPYEVLTLSSDQLGDPESVEIGERPYQLLEALELPRGTQISLGLSDLVEASLGDRIGRGARGIRLEYAASIGLALLMVLVIAYAVWRRSRSRQQPVALEASADSAVDDEHQTVRGMLVDLARSFRAGHLSEEEYQRRRRVLASRLASRFRE